MKNFFKILFVNLISASLISNVVAATSDEKKILMAPTETVVNNFNNSTTTPAELIKNYQILNLEKAQELESFFKAHPEYLTVKIPKATLENGSLSFIIDGKKALFSLEREGKMTAYYMGKKIELNFAMTFDEMVKKISTSLDEKYASFFISFFIEDANAMGLTVGVITVAATAASAYILYGKYLQSEFKDYVAMAEKVCNGIPLEEAISTLGLKNKLRKSYNQLVCTEEKDVVSKIKNNLLCSPKMSIFEEQIKLKEIHDQLFDDWIYVCMPERQRSGSAPHGSDKEACTKVTPIRLCIKERIEKKERQIDEEIARDKRPVEANDTSRSNVKEGEALPSATSKSVDTSSTMSK
ncbi:MAG: hypothetical protein ACXVCE_10865 [Bacteriovorax sp.]